ncbi:hypothetical protein HUG10_21125 (plasmid) [Halorarum halophilum]|uniref:Uncharacterized protein n=1 Tax=Halorarum halophilum TaxID=2743090 RepID=A0A7D5GKV1_9EURY|nr:hypothetical protein [Halobaculum halophilum]QLG30091.1 hypothetical protein HUG10_21125 [Halobaculum halophilum]
MGLSRHAIHQLYGAIAEAHPETPWWQVHYESDVHENDWVLVDGETEADVRARWDELKENARDQTDTEIVRIVPLNDLAKEQAGATA